MKARTQTTKAQLHHELAQAQKHLAFLERCATHTPGHQTPLILLATPDMIAVARAKVAALERWLTDTGQLALFT